MTSVVTQKSKNKLQEALTNYFGENIFINISSSESDLSTLHKRKEEDYNNKISKANDLIDNDDFVKTIKKKFKATSIDNSVKINKNAEGE